MTAIEIPCAPAFSPIDNQTRAIEIPCPPAFFLIDTLAPPLQSVNSHKNRDLEIAPTTSH